jgi:hypothetical protein
MAAGWSKKRRGRGVLGRVSLGLLLFSSMAGR